MSLFSLAVDPECPNAGVLLSPSPYAFTCSTYDQLGTFADGNCGTYVAVTEVCSAACNPPANGTVLSQSCNGYELRVTYANGNCGSYTQTAQSCSSACGAPAAGTYLGSAYCSGYDLYGYYANGSCGSYTQIAQSCSSACGAPAAGTLLSGPTCVGSNLVATYANGTCGSYDQVTQYNAPQCAPPPSGGTLNCWHQPDLWCTFSPASNSMAQWQYSYSTGAFGPWYTSGDTVNWGNCLEPIGAPSFTINIEARSTSGASYTSTVRGCR